MTRSCCRRTSCFRPCHQDCCESSKPTCASCSCNSCSVSVCSKRNYFRCYKRCKSCSPCQRTGHDEKKQKGAKCEKKTKKSEGETIVCKQICMPRKEWNAEGTSPRKVSRKDVVYEVPGKNFNINPCGMRHAYRHGNVFNVGKGETEGKSGSFAALKWVRASHSCDRDHYSLVMREAKDCSKVVEAFLNEVDTGGWKVKVLMPRKMKMNHCHGHSAIVEPFLEDYYTFYKSAKDIRKMGSHSSDKVLQALLHFSIIKSKKKQMMTNLEGYVDEKKKTIFLSGPVIRKDGQESSHGKEADISTFLKRHECSSMCKKFEEPKSPRRKRFLFIPA